MHHQLNNYTLLPIGSIVSRSKKLNLPAEDLKLTPVTALSAGKLFHISPLDTSRFTVY